MENKPNPVQLAVDVIASAKVQVNEILNDPAYVHNLLSINSSLDQIKTRLGFMGTVVVDSSAPKEIFPPITSFMGEKIVRAAILTKEDLNPAETEKKIYVARVNKLQETITSMSSDIILKSYTNPEDIAVLRGVAKRAGVPGFMDHELNIEFVEAIKTGLTGVQSNYDAEFRIEKELAGINDEDELLRRTQELRKGGGVVVADTNADDHLHFDQEESESVETIPTKNLKGNRNTNRNA